MRIAKKMHNPHGINLEKLRSVLNIKGSKD